MARRVQIEEDSDSEEEKEGFQGEEDACVHRMVNRYSTMLV